MELINRIGNYEELRGELNKELMSAANSFVRIGYLLKLARDTDILSGSSYADVNDFATAEFGLDKSQVSRFIRINDRFSINGNSEELLPEYAAYGSAKLSLMLTLPDEINEELSPEYSKTDIQAIKEEYEAEQKITDLEVMIEPEAEQPETDGDEFLALVVKQLNDEHPGPVDSLHFDIWPIARNLGIEPNIADMKEVYMPDGERIYSIRISGQGRFMVSMKEEGITVTNMRDPSEKSQVSWMELTEYVLEDEARREFKKPEEPKKTETPPAPKAPAKPKKVEKAKAAKPQSTEQNSGLTSVSESEKPENKIDDGEEKTDALNENTASKDFDTKMNAPESEQNEEPEAAGLEKVEGEPVIREEVLIDKLKRIIHSPMIKDYLDEIKPYGRYRDALEYLGAWSTDINNTINQLFTELHKSDR